MPDALKKPPDLICKACLPQDTGVLVLDQVTVFEHVTGFVVDDSSNEMVGNLVLNGELVCRECIAYGSGRGRCGVDG